MIKDKFITLRVSPEIHIEFNKKASKYGRPSQVHHEIIEAFLDDRLVNKKDPRKESLYDN